MYEQTAQTLLTLYSQVATLKLLPRTGWLQRGIASAESIAEHTFGVTTLSLLVGDTIAGLDRGRILAIAILHDLAEVYLGDLPASARRYIKPPIKHEAERHALEELLAGLPKQTDYVALWAEYANGSSPEARLVKALDRIEMLIQAFAYERSGNRMLEEFWQDADQGWSDEFPILCALAAQLLVLRNQELGVRSQESEG